MRAGFHDFENEIFHICKLFFEEVEWADRPDGESGDAAAAELLIRAELTEHGSPPQVTAQVRLSLANGEAAAHKQETRPLPGGSEEERRRQRKRTLGAALLQALQEWTGMEQPWGILTGVRPMKLLHNMMMQEPMDVCRQMLRDEYLLSEEKVRLLSDIGELQLKVIPDLFRLDREVSLYIGIPFCPTKCAYCTFPAYDIRGNNGSVEAFLEGLHHEIRRTGEWLKESGLGLTTVYWGGGTPTSIEAGQMDALFETLHASIPGMDRVRELTVEAGRPDTITVDKIQVMKRWKVDRISINPQSFTQATLDTIGRHHTVKETVEKFLLCRELGMNNINMDLILGLPNEGIRELELSLRETERLMPESLTVHTLSFKRASRMTQNRDRYEVAERDEIQDMMRMTTEWTASHGYNPYYMYRQKNILGNQENVGYALPGFESLYNIVMMEERQTIIGLGCGAVSKIIGPDGAIERFPNPKEPSVYNNAYKEYTEKKLQLLDRIT
ncbi:coproporphyrinogen III oxidase [Gorillibacterium sp. sgz5001074]|uniref:coproporphyrinogen III oxidase n=1 Tax=Gorillibacterium sp. sgz5001074 TaxID=3446695 RepID=UPI003F676928